MAITNEFAATTEAISVSDFESLGNQGTYHIVSGGAQSYSVSDLTVDIASGVATIAGNEVAFAGGTVTLVPDVSNDRWALMWIDDNGDDGITHGDAAATPLVPSITDAQVMVGKTLVDAGLTIANSATVKLDKRTPGGGAGSGDLVISADEPTSPTAGQLWIDITDDEYPLAMIARDDGA
jgi:hypothetical protein